MNLPPPTVPADFMDRWRAWLRASDYGEKPMPAIVGDHKPHEKIPHGTANLAAAVRSRIFFRCKALGMTAAEIGDVFGLTNLKHIYEATRRARSTARLKTLLYMITEHDNGHEAKSPAE